MTHLMLPDALPADAVLALHRVAVARVALPGRGFKTRRDLCHWILDQLRETKIVTPTFLATLLSELESDAGALK